MAELTANFLALVNIMDELREKCPWDKKQTIHSLRSLTLEETYELTDAILEEDWENIKEELGDMLLHIVFYAKIAEEQSKFTLAGVLEKICNKLIVRHPHIYGDVIVNDEEDVKRNWESIKLKEGKKSVFEGLPVSLPALVKALRIQEKAKQSGFDWNDKQDVWKKMEEEMKEFEDAVLKNDRDNMEEELGDVLFTLVNYARFLHLDPETSLEKSNKKFIERFTKMHQAASEEGKQFDNLSLSEMDIIWNRIKKENKFH